uniref:hypothetical protein n=1 Tax=Spongiivirga citrea TaxID=1481457 RepID=UPI003742375C
MVCSILNEVSSSSTKTVTCVIPSSATSMVSVSVDSVNSSKNIFSSAILFSFNFSETVLIIGSGPHK